MSRPEGRESRPAVNGPAQSSSTGIAGANHDFTAGVDVLEHLDARAERLRAYLVVQVVVDDEGHLRTNWYRSAAAAERCVKRARDRGRTSHVSIVQMLPVGVVVGLGGA